MLNHLKSIRCKKYKIISIFWLIDFSTLYFFYCTTFWAKDFSSSSSVVTCWVKKKEQKLINTYDHICYHNKTTILLYPVTSSRGNLVSASLKHVAIFFKKVDDVTIQNLIRRIRELKSAKEELTLMMQI